MPVIDDNGTIVADSMEIVRYLEDRSPDPPLYPPIGAPRAEMLVFIDWFNRVWKRPPIEIEAELGKPDPDHERIAHLADEMAAALNRFEAMLSGRNHLMGNDFSAADCAAFPFLKYALSRDPADDLLFHRILDDHQQLAETRAAVADWIRRVNERPRA